MDKIWYRNPSNPPGRCGGDEKPNDHVENTTVECLKKRFGASKLYHQSKFGSIDTILAYTHTFIRH